MKSLAKLSLFFWLVVLALFVTEKLSGAEPRPMRCRTLALPMQPPALAYVDVVILPGETLTVEWTDDFAAWRPLAVWTEGSEPLWLTVEIPPQWPSGRFFVRAMGNLAPNLLARPNAFYAPAIGVWTTPLK